MRLLLIISLTIIFQTSWTQNYLGRQDVQTFFYPQFSPDSLDRGKDTLEQKELLVKICLLGNHCDFCVEDSAFFEKTFKEYISTHHESIHFADLDKDGDQDIIFNGKECGGMDAGLVEIYENKSDSLVLKFRSEGALINFDFNNLTFVVHDYPCCAEQTHYLIEYNFDSEKFEASAQRAHLLVGHSTLLGGPYFQNKIELYEPYTAPTPIAIRWSANMTDKDPTETCVNVNTNRISFYPESSTGTILYKNSDGWIFVRMDPNLFADNACEDNYTTVLDRLPIYYYGWIKV